MARTIACACQKGGVAKTTTCLTVGAALGAEHNQRVLLVDLDPQASLSVSLKVDVLELEQSIHQVFQAALRKPAALKELLSTAVVKSHLENVDILPATLELSNAELELVSAFEREKVLKKALQPLRRSYDFIFVDCPPSLGILTINALVAADEVIVPVEADYLALRGAELFLEETLPQIRRGLNRKLKTAGVLMTKVDLRTLHGKEVYEAVKGKFGSLVFKTVIPHTVKFRDASIAGETILNFSGRSAAADAYRSIAGELMKGQ